MEEFEVGDTVEVLGNVEDVEWLGYVDRDVDSDDNMDMYVGEIAEIVLKERYSGNNYSYKIEGCRWWWAAEWLSRVPDKENITIEDFGEVIS